MNIGLTIAAIILFSMGLLVVGVVLAEERIKNKYSQSYELWYEQWSAFRKMGLYESACIIKSGFMNKIHYGSMK